MNCGQSASSATRAVAFFMATARWFSDLREAREAEILERLLHAVRDKQYDLPTLVGGLTAILELRSIQRKLDRAIDGRES